MSVSSSTWRVLQDPEFTYYAALFNDRGELVWRSLSVQYHSTADRWLNQARCHGIGAHTQPCRDCKEMKPEVDPSAGPAANVRRLTDEGRMEDKVQP